MNVIESKHDFAALFTIPFEPKKIIYSLNSDFFRSGNAACKSAEDQFAIDLEDDVPYKPLPEFPCGEMGCRAFFTTIQDYEIHFRSAHKLVCSECKKTFPTYNMLDVHIQEKHDSYHEAAKEKNVAKFDCFVEGCHCSYSSAISRDTHVISDHNFPSNFKYQQLKQNASKSEKMEVSEEEQCLKPSKSSTNSKRKPYVPKNVCFGRGSSRTFAKPTGRKVNRDITMKELADAL